MTRTFPTLRRRHTLPAIVLAGLLALTGCASSDEPDQSVTPSVEPDPGVTPDDASAGGLLPPAEGTTDYPLTLETWAGQTVLEERPERVAVIGFSPNLDALEALGVTPVYTMGEETEWEWRDQAWLSSIELVDTATRRDPINFEGIASTNPDLIIATNFIFDEGDYQQLSDIAPVLETAEQIPGDQIEWREVQRLIGETLDLAASAEQSISDAEQRIAGVVEDNPQFAGRTVTIATDYEASGLQYYTVAGGTAETFMTELGFEANPLAENFVDDPVVADEMISLLDADVLIVNYFDQSTREAREASELFQSVPAVAEGRYVAIVTEEPDSGGNVVWVLRRGASVLSLPWGAEVVADNWLADIDLTQ